jgi:Fur family ferric uptake transcriptional regulator
VIRVKKPEAVKAVLKEKGYKLTPQRRATLETFSENRGRHLSTEDVYMLVKQKCPEIGIATVYRTLQLLEQLGAINKLSFDDGCSRYELAGNEEDHHHHHLICMSCGGVQEVEEDLLEHLEQKIKEINNFEVVNHRVKFFGYCSKCLNK